MKITVVKADITTLGVDAIVNAANSSLMGGGGVDGAIHRVGGPSILNECRAIVAQHGGCPTGEAVITSGGNLPSKYVIHTVGPIWKGGKAGEAEKLRDCYLNALRLASQHNCKTIAFPNISTGVYGYPLEPAADIAIEVVTRADLFGIEEVIFVCFDQENYQLYNNKLQIYLK